MMWTIKRFMITIETPDWEDFEDVELPRLPVVGETIETKYGTCLVTQADASSGNSQYAGKSSADGHSAVWTAPQGRARVLDVLPGGARGSGRMAKSGHSS